VKLTGFESGFALLLRAVFLLTIIVLCKLEKVRDIYIKSPVHPYTFSVLREGKRIFLTRAKYIRSNRKM